ncbi:MAG TPA: TlpA disulfide reductase family protein [Syntrophales bacterium]|nr:TlpA disulfide reductase family protein [Syntrophales bacterium]
MKKTALITALALLTVGLVFSAPPSFAGKAGQQTLPAPDFSLRDIAGNEYRMSQFRGRPVLLIFGTTWCPNCRTQIPENKKLHERYANRGLVFFNVNILESREKAASFSKKWKLPYPTLVDAKGNVAEMYRVVGVPMRILVDSRGNITCISCRNLEEKIKQALAVSGK